MKGTVKKVIGSPKPSSFEIEGEDKKTYFAHLGDIKENEELLYSNDNTTHLKNGDKVDFKRVEHREYGTTHAINVKKVD